jgi:hypothetical protein
MRTNLAWQKIISLMVLLGLFLGLVQPGTAIAGTPLQETIILSGY